MPTKAGTKRGTKKRSKEGTKVTSKKTKTQSSMFLSTGYKGVPNTYSFIRETRPTTIDIGANATPGVTIIAGTGAIPDIAVFEFANFSIDQLPGFTEFSSLFASYKIDKIETVLIPQWEQTVQQSINPQTGVWSNTGYIPNLMITRINTKYLPNGYSIKTTAEENRDQLAQIIKKTRSLYGNRKWLNINTLHPRVFQEIEDGQGGQNLTTKASPWLTTADAADQEYSMNDIMFADRLDGSNLSVGLYKYRMYHRVHFRCSFVG